jgi:flagellar basal-body rod protein FlgC
MGFFDGYNVATSGMSAQRTRINVVSANIANAQTTHSKDGGPYKKQNVVFEEVLLDTQKNALKKENLSGGMKEVVPSVGVKVQQVVDSKEAPVLKYDPAHPDANKDGYVAFPNINPVIEMTDLIEALRSYEANLSAFQTQKTMDTKTLDILKA